jgi:heme/copper-type cytochrome/quinol oxidase subunit 4
MVMGARIDWELIITTLLGLAVIAIVLYLIIGFIFMCRAEAMCLEQGFPSSSVVWNLKSYCVSFYDAKPVVVPLR